jgi:hypothetical protein
LKDIIELYQSHGYKFISLADALKGNTAKPVNDSVSEAVSSTPERGLTASQAEDAFFSFKTMLLESDNNSL